MDSDQQRLAGRKKWWPLLVFAVGLLLSVLGPDSEAETFAAIYLLNLALIGSLLTVAVLAIRRRISQRSFIAVLAISIAYHALAAALPRPETGWVRLGVGDLMVIPGVMVHGAVEDVLWPLRRGALADPKRLQAALTTDVEDRFIAEYVAADASGWIVAGRLQAKDGVSLSHLLRLDADSSGELSVVSSQLRDRSGLATCAIHDGTFLCIDDRSITSTVPGLETAGQQLPAETVDWLHGGVSRLIVASHGTWLALIANREGAEVARIRTDGVLEDITKLPFPNAMPHAVTSVGSTIYAITEHYDAQTQWVAHVVGDGVRDEEKSRAMTDTLFGTGLSQPFRLYGAQTTPWLIAFDSSLSASVAIAYPAQQRNAIAPGSPKAVLPQDDDLLVGTHKVLQRIRPDSASEVGQGWIPASMLSLQGQMPCAAVKERKAADLTLVCFDETGPSPFRPPVRLFAQN